MKIIAPPIMKIIFCFSLLVVCSNGFKVLQCNFDFTNLTGFPENFIFSVATASYQVEGAWNTSGKGENIWDRITHTRPDWVLNGDTGDIACDSYNKYKEDVKNIKDIGFQMYRFSLSWSRLFPTGYTSSINQDGVRYYSALIDELIANGIEPMVTLYHWDLPQPLEDIGGWLNPQIADIFAEYARAVFTLFGDKVKWWITINEPQSITDGYGSNAEAPALNKSGIGDYESGHNILRAHGKAYRIYENEFKHSQGGKVSFAIVGNFRLPKNDSYIIDLDAAERANQFHIGWFAHPVYSKEGNYPQLMRLYIDGNSKAEVRTSSRLPYFTEAEIQEIKGSFDFMALNHYTTRNVKYGRTGDNPSFLRDQEVIETPIPDATPTNCDWSEVVPEGFRAVINWMKETYNNPEIFITENGYCGTSEINDQKRVQFIQGYLKNLLASINEDGCRVIGYTFWSLMDNFEWKFGYSKKFGLMNVDFDSPQRNRTKRLSAYFLQELIRRNSGKK